MEGGLVWLYQKDKEPITVDSKDMQSFVDEGWTESPAFFLKPEDLGLDFNDAVAVQASKDMMEGVVECLNGALNLDMMKRDQLKEFALKHFGEKLKKKKKAQMILKIRELLHGTLQ